MINIYKASAGSGKTFTLATLVHSIDNPGDISDEHAEVDSMMNDCSQDF